MNSQNSILKIIKPDTQKQYQYDDRDFILKKVKKKPERQKKVKDKHVFETKNQDAKYTVRKRNLLKDIYKVANVKSRVPAYLYHVG